MIKKGLQHNHYALVAAYREQLFHLHGQEYFDSVIDKVRQRHFSEWYTFIIPLFITPERKVVGSGKFIPIKFINYDLNTTIQESAN